jgi:hypothetical protein
MPFFAILRNSLLSGSHCCGTSRNEGAKIQRQNYVWAVFAEKERGPLQGHECPQAPRTTLDAKYLVSFRASSKGLFRPAARGTGCQLRPATLLTPGYFRAQGRLLKPGKRVIQ